MQMTLICSGEVEVSSGEKRNENQKQDGIHVSEREEDRFKYLGSGKMSVRLLVTQRWHE